MPYFIDRRISYRKTMAVQTPQTLHDHLDLDVRVNTRVFAIDTVGKAFCASKEKLAKPTIKPMTI
jgi:hypothetical protein